jgi:glutathione S-transferase
VVATVGDDPGLTPDERRHRARVRRWEQILATQRQKLIGLEAEAVAIEEKIRRAQHQVERAEEELRADHTTN